MNERQKRTIEAKYRFYRLLVLMAVFSSFTLFFVEPLREEISSNKLFGVLGGSLVALMGLLLPTSEKSPEYLVPLSDRRWVNILRWPISSNKITTKVTMIFLAIFLLVLSLFEIMYAA